MKGGMSEAGSFIQDKRDSSFTDGGSFFLEKRKSIAPVEGSFTRDDDSSEGDGVDEDDTPTKPLTSELNTIKW